MLSTSELEEDIIQLDHENLNILMETYVKDLNEFIQITNSKLEYPRYIKRYLLNKLEEKWMPLLGFSSSTIADDIRDLQTPKDELFNSFGMRDLLAYEQPKSAWIIPNLLPSTGLFLLVALPKTGKTIFARKLQYAVAVSGEFLGRPVRKGRVLDIQLEDSLFTLQKRARLAGFGRNKDEETSMIVNFSDNVLIERVFDITNLEWLKRKIAEFKPDLIIIDSLRMATIGSATSETTNEFGKLVYALQAVINQSNVCCVLIHHMRKSPASEQLDIIQAVSGHTSIAGASDGVLALVPQKDLNGNAFIKLDTKPRDGIEMSISYKLIRDEEGFWQFDIISEDSPSNLPVTSRILRFLSQQPGKWYSLKQLAEGVGIDTQQPDFVRALDYLEASEIVYKKYDRGMFFMMDTNSTWMTSSQRYSDVVSSVIRDANILMMCENKSALRYAIDGWDRQRLSEAAAVLLPEERARIKNLINSYQFEIGEIVFYDNQIYSIEDREEHPTLTATKYLLSNGEWVLEKDLTLESVSYNIEDTDTVDTQIVEELNV